MVFDTARVGRREKIQIGRLKLPSCIKNHYPPAGFKRNAHIGVENTTLLTWRIPADGRTSKSPGRSTRPRPCRPVRPTGGADGGVTRVRRRPARWWWPGPPSWHSDGTGGICRRPSTPIGTVPTGRGTERSRPPCPPSTATKTTAAAAAATRTVFRGTRPPT